MRMYDLIMKKRKGEELTTEEINFFVEGFTDGSIPDYQASAAWYFHTFSEDHGSDQGGFLWCGIPLHQIPWNPYKKRSPWKHHLK